MMIVFSSVNIPIMTLIITISIIMGLIPILMNMQLIPSHDGYRTDNFVINLRVTDLGYSFIAEFTVSMLFLMDIVVCHIMSPAHSTMQESLLIIMQVSSFLVPDLVSFFFAIPQGNASLIFFVFNERICIFYGTLLIYLSVHGGKIWNGVIARICFITVVFGGPIRYIGGFFPLPTGIIISIIGDACFFIAWFCLLFLAYKWYQNVKVITRINKLTDSDYVVTIYVLYFLVHSVTSIFILGSVVNTPYENTPMSVFMISNYLIALYFALLFIFQKQYTRQNIRTVKDELEFKRMFVNYISHEIRTPLNAVSSGLELLEEDLKRITNANDLLETVADSQKSCDAALCVVNDLLTFDKLEGGNLQLEKSEFDAWPVVQETVAFFRTQARKGRIELLINQVNGENDETCNNNRCFIISADKNKFVQVLRNMISNALKFTPKGGSVTIRVKTRNIMSTSASIRNTKNIGKQLNLVIDVIDTGVGLSMEQQGKLFKSIIQFNAGKLQKGGGSGLGLYICQGIMKLHNGVLSVYSNGIGCGSIFTMTMPCLSDKEVDVSIIGIRPSLSPSSPHPSLPSSPTVGSDPLLLLTNNISQYNNRSILRGPRTGIMNQIPYAGTRTGSIETAVTNTSVVRTFSASSEMSQAVNAVSAGSNSIRGSERSVMYRVLVVDDVQLSRKMASKILNRLHCECESAVDGKDAVEIVQNSLAQQKTFDLVITDYEMPNMDGPESVKQMRAVGYTGKVVGITGHADASYADIFISHGANRVLVKPVLRSDYASLLDMTTDLNWRVSVA